MAYKKTKKMLEVERRFGRDLTELLAESVTEHGLSETADLLGQSKATVGYWLLKLDITVKRVALGPDDTLNVWRGQRADQKDKDPVGVDITQVAPLRKVS